ncbi:type II toxin-antitoxin system VapC family toxin [Sphingomonas gilva]|uniref:type II toxin-antitoxin system VapC family toxin n=1 Tax=Sphingomonas gilva TaxID=2305907 RepID=UPI0015FAC31C|nr:type II toxin-antitoxin system VapC family toxin [Sphingomonas gilva]
MKAVDANVVLRVIVPDDPHQTAIAEEILRGPVILPLTALLEIVWVLRSRYRFSRTDTAGILDGILSYDNIEIEAPILVHWAIQRFAAGADIADMIHLVMGRHASAFATFDREVARQAGDRPPIPVETLR